MKKDGKGRTFVSLFSILSRVVLSPFLNVLVFSSYLCSCVSSVVHAFTSRGEGAE